ncbi:glycerate kinase [Agrococcus sp. ARC_14]|uniref:glycerate kinase family protein n=1 Tax=Agrococcus sp. ARC_14 TaxID=2919927 RepID=UPI001F06619A|nr:glycerate kinase [Agrococcus sp. ARC_14]MCH1882797.1 glycerate kinase [Agrococcus sp. ARC_14]
MSVQHPISFLVAPSGFKESLAAEEVAAAIAIGIRRVVPGARIRLLPLVDGGEGTAAAMAASTGGRIERRSVTGPVGEQVDSHFAILGDGTTAVVEMAAAAGLSLVPRDRRDPTRTTTRGVGELMVAALDAGCTRIVVGCGDSGTSDGGAGALQALGARLLDAHGSEIGAGARALAKLDRIDMDGLDPRLADVAIEVACNPTNVLTGPRGVARVFGPQKGADPAQVDRLAKALKRWVRTLERDAAYPAGTDLRRGLGTGASGGLGAGLAAIGATLLPRFEVLLESIDLDGAIAEADLVITAEGSIDRQTPNGKVPAEVASRAQRLHVPVLALAGTIGSDAGRNYDIGIDAIQCVLPSPVELQEAFDRGAEFVADGAERVVRTLLLGAALARTADAPVAEALAVA